MPTQAPGPGVPAAADPPPTPPLDLDVEILRAPVRRGETRPLAWRREQLRRLEALVEETGPALHTALEQRPADAVLNSDAAQQLLGEALATAGIKKGLLMKSLRAALLGSLQGPDLQDTWLLLHHLGEDRSRIARCL